MIVTIIFIVTTCTHKSSNTSDDEAQNSTKNNTFEWIYANEVSLEAFDTIYRGCFAGNVAGYHFTFADYIKQHPESFYFPFNSMCGYEDNPLHIVDSPDKKIRFYCSDCSADGKGGNTLLLYQIEHNGKICTYNDFSDLGDKATTPIKIHLLPHKKKNYYIIIYYYNEWASLSQRCAVTYELIGKELRQVELFEQPSDTQHNGHTKIASYIDYEYDVPDYYTRFARAMGFNYHFYFNPLTTTLYLPLFREEKGTSNICTDKYIPYHWNGERLTTDGMAVCNPDINERYRNYDYIAQAFSYERALEMNTARIDVMKDGSYRYISWMDIDMEGEPTIVINNGTADEKNYYFHNKNYIYVISKEDVPIIRIYYSHDPQSLGRQLDQIISFTNYAK